MSINTDSISLEVSRESLVQMLTHLAENYDAAVFVDGGAEGYEKNSNPKKVVSDMLALKKYASIMASTFDKDVLELRLKREGGKLLVTHLKVA